MYIIAEHEAKDYTVKFESSDRIKIDGGGEKIFMHLELKRWNKSVRKDINIHFAVMQKILINNDIKKIYVLVELDDTKKIKFYSLYYKLEYVTSLKLEDGIDYNLISINLEDEGN